MPECPACGSPIEANHRECAACGAVLEGATEDFAPVGSVEAGPSEAPAAVPSLTVRSGPDAGERFFLDRDELTIGRDPACDVFLNDVTVSRHHAVLRAAAGVVGIEDAGSLNGTYVNGVRVDSAILGHGDSVRIGRFLMSFTGGGGR
ncbi:MAG: FHA domain-containing protein [Actinobacteria bacterium]|nr:MAG: FHA domain-containing protein [Actinomycetota bacterium]